MAATTQAAIRRQTVTAMKRLGVYRPEYDRLIDYYAGLWEQYHRLMAEYDTGEGYAYAVPTADGGAKKSPLAGAVEAVRRDILACSDRLCLNPKAERDGKAQPARRSKLEEALGGGE